LKFICINKERFNPINFGINYHEDGYDGCMCFHMTSDKMISASLYNDNGEVDCSVIAKSFGGGGHKGAAGFRITLEQFNNLIK
jgi:nanoRNase/pAp phosphatase (c-di-AMP/oligoRNAs hydrolase)